MFCVGPTGFSWPATISNSWRTQNGAHWIVQSAKSTKMTNKSLDSAETTVAKNGNVEASGQTEKSGAISADISLPNDLLERLYQRYSIKQRRAGLECFLATSVLFDLWAIFAPHQEKSVESVGKSQYHYSINSFNLISNVRCTMWNNALIYSWPSFEAIALTVSPWFYCFCADKWLMMFRKDYFYPADIHLTFHSVCLARTNNK